MDKDRFDRAIATVVTRFHENHGIGTLSEKSVHAVVKCYMEPDEDYHETPIDGYVADIFRDGRVIEIQTAQFRSLRDKLGTFLPNYEVTVVHPIAATKTLCWVDPETGETTERRKSTKKGVPQDIFEELYAIRPFLADPHLSIVILMLDVEETKLLDGYGRDRKKRATKYDRIPLGLVEELWLTCPEDYRALIPIELEKFTSTDYAKATHIPREVATWGLQIMHELGVVERIGREKKGYVYEVL